MAKLRTHDKEEFKLARAVADADLTLLLSFRGPWCPGCQAWWRQMRKRRAEFAAAGVQVIGLSADRPKDLRAFRDAYKLPFTMVSDPRLWAADRLEVETSRFHPKAREYPEGAFLQPGAFLWTRDGKLRWSWRAESRLGNLFGAIERPTAKQLLKRARKHAPEARAESSESAA